MKINKTLIICLIVLFTLFSCANDSRVNDKIDFQTLTKDHQPRELSVSGVIHRNRVYIPYPLGDHHSDIGFPFAIAELDNEKVSFVNDNPSNLCNKGDSSQCSTFNKGWIESVLVSDGYIISVEDSLSATNFEGYLTIRQLDGSNRKEIFKLKTGYLPLPSLEIQNDNENIYFVFEDELYNYSIKNDKISNLSEEESLVGIKNLKLENDVLYFSVEQYEHDNEKYLNSILTYDGKFTSKVDNVANEIIRVYSDKYFTRKDIGEQFSETYVNYYTNTDLIVPTEHKGFITILNVDDHVVTYETLWLDEELKHFVKLYKDNKNELIEQDVIEFPSGGMYYLHAMENNKVLLGMAVNEEVGIYIEAITTEIVDGKFNSPVRYPYTKY